LRSVDALIEKFQIFYTSGSPKWDNISDLASFMGWVDLISNSTADYFMAKGVSKQYTYEVIEASTRVNYGQVCLRRF
jgi:prenylcysteine oxidase / farnesylcysteine lyase